MSYILDALKKSEEQRDSGHTAMPRPQTQPNSDSKTSYYIVALTVLGLLFFALVALYLQQHKQHQIPNNTDTVTAVQRQGLSTTSAATKSQPTKKQAPLYHGEPASKVSDDKPFADAYTNLSNPLINDANRQARLRESNLAKYEDVANLSESDIGIQYKIPTLDYSSHWFDDNATKSTIIINNRSLKENDWINNNIQLKKILSEESIFEIEERYFKLRSLQNWSP